MKKLKGNKKVICSLLLILMLAITFLMVFTQSSLAQIGVPQPEKTVGYISVAPTLIGVGQTATVNLWLFPLPTTYLYEPYFEGFFGVTVTFVKPNGSEDTFMPVDGTHQYEPGQTQSLGALYFYYEPDMAGDWSVSFTMPAQDITTSDGTVQYMACTSNSFSFTVTEEEQLAGLLNGYPWAQLPDENTYWSYPINSNNREWYQISGDYLPYARDSAIWGVTCRHWQPYGPGPNTGHILWTQRYSDGGLIGGDYGSLSYMTGRSSTTKGAIVMDGKVFYNIVDMNQFQCADLATGEILYTLPGAINTGIHLPGDPHAQAYLDPSVLLESSFGRDVTSCIFDSVGSTWNYYDPGTGKLVRSLSNCSSATLIDGTNLAYGRAGGNLTAWDMSKVVGGNWPTGIVWTQPLPESLLAGSASLVGSIQIEGFSTDLSIVVLGTVNEYWGYSTEDGTQLWDFTLTYPVAANEEISLYGVDKFIIFDPTETTWHCYSMLTGAELWESDSYADSPWATTWTVYSSESNDYDNLYLVLPDGTACALSLETGKEVWRSTAFPSTEVPNNVNPYVYGNILAGGNIYAYAGYSIGYQINPLPRFAMLVCINATTGDITWTLNGGVHPVAAANGYVIGEGIFDGKIYCVGKGPTSTSVIIQDDVVANGNTVLIKGNVFDQSPAAQDYDSQVLFPKGVPAVADEDMSEFMDYLYMQNATLLNNPPTPDGVPVNLFVVKPDGTEDWITTVTSDSYGNYAHLYTPQTEGVYKVIAKFEGSESYWPSSSETSFGVTPAAAAGGPIEPEEPTTPPPTEEPTTAPPTEEPTTEVPTTEEPTTTPPTEEPSEEAPFPTTEVVIVAAVAVAAVVGIGAYWILRKQK